MAKYKVAVNETQTYEVFVEANTQEEAEELALECYGCDGEIGCTLTEILETEEVK